MYGRYGTDELNLVLMILGIIVMFLSRIFWFWPLAMISYALYKEYYSFLKVWTPVQKWFRIKKTAFRERKQYKYFRCPGCRQQLRAPRGRGKILVTCQRCHKQFKQKT